MRVHNIRAYSGTRNEGFVVAEFEHEDNRLGWQIQEGERSSHGWGTLIMALLSKYLYACRAQSPAVQSFHALDHNVNEPQRR